MGVGADINEKAKIAVQDREKLIDMIMAKDSKTSRKDHSKHEQAISQSRKRLSEIEKLVDRLYEEHILGTLSDENYQRMMLKYQGEQDSLLQELDRLGMLCRDDEVIQSEAEKFAELISMFDGVTELNSDMLNTLIDRIEVHEVEVIDEERKLVAISISKDDYAKIRHIQAMHVDANENEET